MKVNKCIAMTFALSGLFLMGCSDGFMNTKADKVATHKTVRGESTNVDADGKLTNDLSTPLIGTWYSACIEDINVDTLTFETMNATDLIDNKDSELFKREVYVFEANGKAVFETTTYLDSNCVVERSAEKVVSSTNPVVLNYKVNQRDEDVTLLLYTDFNDAQLTAERSVKIQKGKLTLTSIVDEETAKNTSKDLLINEYYSSINVAAFLKRKVDHKKVEEMTEAGASDEAKSGEEASR